MIGLMTEDYDGTMNYHVKFTGCQMKAKHPMWRHDLSIPQGFNSENIKKHQRFTVVSRFSREFSQSEKVGRQNTSNCERHIKKIDAIK